MNGYSRVGSLFALMLIFSHGSPAGGEEGPARSIEHLREGVYRFNEDRHSSLFMVTDEGIIVTDPLNSGTAAWLKGGIAKRFARPVRYVIYSHNHSDHVYGGEVFDEEGVIFISHRLAKEDLTRTKAKTRIPDTAFEDEKSSASEAGVSTCATTAPTTAAVPFPCCSSPQGCSSSSTGSPWTACPGRSSGVSTSTG